MTLEVSHLELSEGSENLELTTTAQLFQEETADPETSKAKAWCVLFVSYLLFPFSPEADFLGHN